MPKDYYSVLDVDRSATRDQIRARFLALARERHPDLYSGDDKQAAEERFQGITEAFNVLFNPERRRLHDMELSQGKAENQAADPEALMKVYLSRGIKAYKERNYAVAAENFDRATLQQPDNSQAWYYMALVCTHNPKWRSRGLKAITKACELDKMNVQYYKTAGKMFHKAGMGIRAERYYRSAIEWGGPDPEIEQAIQELKRNK